MLRLHCYSNYVRFKLEPIDEEEEVYGVNQIKEFEEVSQLYKEWLAELLEQGIRFICECLFGVCSKCFGGNVGRGRIDTYYVCLVYFDCGILNYIRSSVTQNRKAPRNIKCGPLPIPWYT